MDIQDWQIRFWAARDPELIAAREIAERDREHDELQRWRIERDRQFILRKSVRG